MLTGILIVVTIFGLYMAWNIGANDVANSMADAVGSRAISIRGAVIAAGAVVTKDVPANSLAAGVPAEVIREGVQWH